jgi:GNAT superfamily N-acetyltransferase
MRIVELDQEHATDFVTCFEPDTLEASEGAERRRRWLARMQPRGLRVKIALDDLDRPAGLIQYIPAVHAPIAACDGIYFILCIWVHGHRERIGNQQGHGLGSALLAAAEEDARSLGARGMAAWGLRLPMWMRASWFKKHGYHRVDADGIRALVFKAFEPDVPPPRWLRSDKRPADERGRVVLTSCGTGWCLAQNAATERAIRVARGLGIEVVDRDTCCDRRALEEWGTDAALFLDDRPVRTGPPPSESKLARMMRRRLRAKHIRP